MAEKTHMFAKLLERFGRSSAAPDPVPEAFVRTPNPYVFDIPADFEDPYQQYLDRCTPHPKDPTVFLTTDPDNLHAIHSPRAAAVFCVREIPEELKREIAALSASPDVIELVEGYRYRETGIVPEWDDLKGFWDRPAKAPVGMDNIRADMRYVARLRSELADAPILQPRLVTQASEKEAKKDVLLADNLFHSDREDVGLRLHVTYDGPQIQGLSSLAIQRLEAAGIDTYPTTQAEQKILADNLTAEDIIDDIPMLAIGAFKGKDYVPPYPNSPPHIHWRHRGPNRDVTPGIAAIFGVIGDLDPRRQRPVPEASI